MTKLIKFGLILLMIGCSQIQPRQKTNLSLLTKKDSSLLSKYTNFLDKSGGFEKHFINDLISTMITFQSRKLDTTILSFGMFDIDSVTDTISTRIFLNLDTVLVRSTWTKNSQLLWSNEFKDPYMAINSDSLFEYGTRSNWVTFTIGYKYAIPEIGKITDKNNLFNFAVDFGTNDLRKNGIIVDNETYKQYLINFKGDLLTWGHPENRDGMFIWYDPAKRFVLFYHD